MLIDSKITADLNEPSRSTFAQTQTSDGTRESPSTTGERGLEGAIDEPLHEVSPKIEAEQGVMAKKAKKKAPQTRIELVHCDIIKDDFWNARPGILGE